MDALVAMGGGSGGMSGGAELICGRFRRDLKAGGVTAHLIRAGSAEVKVYVKDGVCLTGHSSD